MQLNELLTQKGVVLECSPIDNIVERARMKKDSSKPMSILYGETFDEKGNTIDSCKYYFFVNMLSRALNQLYNVDVKPVILVADLGVYRNYPEEIEQFKKFAQDRKNFANRIKDVFKCSYKVELMSELVGTNEFDQRVQRIRELSFSDHKILEMIEKTVPEDRLEMERKRGYTYSFEEIATILGLDIKVGPPREKFYDRTANTFLKHFAVDTLFAVYLYPTYPLGMAYGDYLSSPSIKEFGLTPYKVGSGGMTQNRIALGRTTPEEIKTLIDNTQISQSTAKPNPILDLAIISEMAKQHLEEDFRTITLYDDFYSKRLTPKQLKELTYDNLQEYIVRFF